MLAAAYRVSRDVTLGHRGRRFLSWGEDCARPGLPFAQDVFALVLVGFYEAMAVTATCGYEAELVNTVGGHDSLHVHDANGFPNKAHTQPFVLPS